jgi:hypothetical protein
VTVTPRALRRLQDLRRQLFEEHVVDDTPEMAVSSAA